MISAVSDPFVHRHRVRLHECDGQGRVFNARYLEYADIAMVELMRAALGSYLSLAEAGVEYVVAEANLSFAAAARLDELLEVRVEVRELGRSSLRVGFEVSSGARPVATIELRYVCLDRETGTPTAWPDFARGPLGDQSD